MKISYDQETDALYIRLVEGHHECRTLRLSEEIALNIAAGEVLIGIEILDAKEILGAGQLPQVVLENIPFEIVPIAA
ncbi:DUF2283 domain-containing protein [Pseudanabaena sp. 'Roaring Creek']|uniref:DUF2283 domain-containing protein n=1 Tax=Pseudanabaena sp. 'Roaring Creek' TaxID=1681830 RepID=UPI0006D7A270|nr:DUF2283 domain-containing protein [Pseudanabaena sp. 'Roaring Creek']